MAYVDQQPMSRGKVIAIGAVAALHLALFMALKSGLDYNAAMEVFEDLKTFDIKEEKKVEEDVPPPPPPKDLPPPPKMDVPPPPVMAAAPIVTPAPVAAPAPPPEPPRPSVAKGASPRGNPSLWVTTEDYPSGALREGREGVTSIAYDITVDGHIANCRITGSSGASDLDDAACKYVTRRGRFNPAQDQNGNPIQSTGVRRVRWQIPKE